MQIVDFKMSEKSCVSPSDHCHYVVPRKKRRCKMLIKSGNFYCGEHSHLLTNKDDKKEDLAENRIPCPLDPKHSCSVDKLQKHLDKCPSKPKAMPSYISPGVNLPSVSDKVKGLTVATASDELLLDIIARLERIYTEDIAHVMPTEILKHPSVEEEIQQDHIGAAASKHLVQNSSLLGHLENIKAFEVIMALFDVALRH